MVGELRGAFVGAVDARRGTVDRSFDRARDRKSHDEVDADEHHRSRGHEEGAQAHPPMFRIELRELLRLVRRGYLTLDGI